MYRILVPVPIRHTDAGRWPSRDTVVPLFFGTRACVSIDSGLPVISA
jgi:hypothetical protein